MRYSSFVVSMVLSLIVIGETQSSASPVAAKTAFRVANVFVALQSGMYPPASTHWSGARIESGPDLFDCSGKLIARCFSVCKGRLQVGYMLVAGDTRMPPVLEWSLGPCPYLRPSSSCIEALENYCRRYKLKRYKLHLIYTTPGRTIAMIDWPTIPDKHDVWLDLQSSSMQVSRLPAVKSPLDCYPANSSAYKSQWQRLCQSSMSGSKSSLRMVRGIPWLSYFRSTHVVSAGCAMANLHANGRNEVAKAYLSRLGNFIEHCLCDRPGKPITSIITAGAANFGNMRGLAFQNEEYVVRGPSRPKHLTYIGYVKSVNSNCPVILTYSGHKEDAENFEHARLRLDTVSSLGYGYLSDATGNYAMSYFPSPINGESAYETMPAVCDKPGIIFINWDAPSAGELGVTIRRRN